MPAPDRVEVVVVGGGPAGAALARAMVRRGLETALVDPTPGRPWPASYGAWADELPAWLPAGVVAGRLDDATATGRTGTVHALGRDYVMLSTSGLQAALGDPDVRLVAGRALGPPDPDGTLRLDGDRRLRADVLVDASGPRRALVQERRRVRRRHRVPASQTAHGVVVPAVDAAGVAVPLSFMDWRADHGQTGWPTFLYAVPLGDGRVLLEETSLARRPGLALPVLRDRLAARLAARGIEVPPDAAREDVAFPVDLPPARGAGRVVTFGAAAPLVHPATGYSLATSLRLAEDVARAVAGALRGTAPTSGEGAAAAARAVVWPPGALAVHHLRRRGLEVLLSLPPEGVGDFFDVFFSLPAHHQRAYLSERRHPAPVLRAMTAVWAGADGPLRRHLRRWGTPLAGDTPAR